MVTPCHGGKGANPKTDRVSQTVRLILTRRGWQFAGYDVPWSDYGSGKGNTFPPYPEAREF